MPHLEEDFANLLDDGAKDYKKKRGTWKNVKYTPTIVIKVQKIRTTYNVFLYDKTIRKFIAVLNLVQEKLRVDRKDYLFFTPMSFILPEYRGRGLFMPLYNWVIRNGIDLIADFNQTPDSNNLWKKLIQHYRYASFNHSTRKFDANETIAKTRDVKRLMHKDYRTLLFCKQWSDQGLNDFIQKIIDRRFL